MRTLFVGLLSICAAACGGGDDVAGADAGACPSQPATFAWPSEDDPQVCATPPTLEVVRTQCGMIDEDCAEDGITAPVLDCLTNPPGMLPDTPATVTLAGYADVFSSGPDSNGARLEVYRASEIGDGTTPFSQLTPLATFDFVLDATTIAGARACPLHRDEPEALKGRCVQPDADCGGACDRDLDAVDFCYASQCWEISRWEIRYQVPNLPTNTFLVLRTVGLTGGSPNIAHETWAPMIQENVFLSTAERACTDTEDENCLDTSDAMNPVYRLKVNLLSRSDYETIPQTMGLSAGVAGGHGAIAGEVHDCTDIRLTNAHVGFSRRPLKFAYFNGNPVKTLPELGRAEGTNEDGLYAGLDLAPGEVQIEAIGLVGGAVTSLGRFRARVFADSVTVVGINGGKPPQP